TPADNAPSSTTSPPRKRPRPAPPLPPPSFSVEFTSTLRDCQAGANPNNNPVVMAAPKAKANTRQSTLISATLGSKPSGSAAINASVPHTANSAPAAPPISATTALSATTSPPTPPPPPPTPI